MSEGTKTPADAIPADHCPYRRPFPPGFNGCPTFQPAPFIAANSREEPMGTHLSCVHLRSGQSSYNHFYAQCALGDPMQRSGWLERVGAARVATMRSLQREFEQVAQGYRERLAGLKARVLAVPQDMATSAQLDALCDEFLSACADFNEAHAATLDTLGLPPASLQELLVRVMREWRRSRVLDAPRVDTANLDAFSPDARVLLGAGTPVAAEAG